MKTKVILLLITVCVMSVKSKPEPLHLLGLSDLKPDAGNVISNKQKIFSSQSQIGDRNKKLGILEASPQLLVLADLLSSKKQLPAPGVSGSKNIINNSQTQTQEENTIGTDNVGAKVGNVNPQLDIGVGVLNKLKQGILGGQSGQGSNINIISTSQDQKSIRNIIGKKNVDIQTIKANPQVKVGANILRDVKQLILPKLGKKLSGSTSGEQLRPGGDTASKLGSTNNPVNAISNQQSQSGKKSTIGNGNIDAMLVEANPQANAGITILNKVTHTFSGSGSAINPTNTISNQQFQNDESKIIGDDNIKARVLELIPQASSNVGLLNSVQQIIKGNPIRSASNSQIQSQTKESSINVKGDRNLLVEPAKVALQGIVNIDALSSSKQIVDSQSGKAELGTNVVGASQTRNSNTNIEGDNNFGILGPVIAPQLIADLGVGNDLLQGIGLGSIVNSGNNNKILRQSSNDSTNIRGSGNTFLGLGKVAPQAIIKADILGEVKQLLQIVKDPTVLLTGTDGNDDDCKNAMRIIQEQNSEFNTIGDGNLIIDGPDVSPQIVADLNIISGLIQSGQCEARIASTTTDATMSTETSPPVTTPIPTSSITTSSVITPPITTPLITTSSETTPPITTSPITTPPITTPPITTLPVTTPIVTTPPVTTSPTTTPFITTPPVTTPLLTTPSVTTPPITTPPVTSPPNTTATIPPVTTTPVMTTPVTSSPVTTPPITTSPVTTPSRKRCFRRYCRKWRVKPQNICQYDYQYPNIKAPVRPYLRPYEYGPLMVQPIQHVQSIH